MAVSKEIASSFLSSLEGSFAKQFEEAISDVSTKSVDAARRKTIAERKSEWTQAVENLDVEQLSKLDATMSEYIDNLVTISASTPRELEKTEVSSLMSEYLRLETIAEFMDVRRATMKLLVFAHLDETVGVGENGAIVVQELGKQFKREGAGQADPSLDLEELARVLGPEMENLYETVTVPEQIIPAHTDRVFSEARLVAMVQAQPEKMEALKAAIKPGKAKTPKFIVRSLPKK